MSSCIHSSEDGILFWFSIFTDGVASVFLNMHKSLYIHI